MEKLIKNKVFYGKIQFVLRIGEAHTLCGKVHASHGGLVGMINDGKRNKGQRIEREYED